MIKLYENLCQNNGIDDGKSFSYETYFVVNEEITNNYQFDYWGPFSTVSRLCNMIAICTSSVIGAIRIILTYDNFKTCAATHIINPQIPEIFEYDDYRSFLILEELITCCKNEFNNYGFGPPNNRISTALEHFYHTWRASYYYVRTCVNIAITLETLFAPYSKSKISHQISYNLSHILGNTSTYRDNIYKKARCFYELRSEIIHGSISQFEKLHKIVPEMYRVLCHTLKMIMRDSKKINVFNDDSKRKALFNKWLSN